MAGNALIKLRRDTAANWTSANPTLAAGEPGFETDTKKIKYGDGTTAWTSLAYAAGSTGVVPTSRLINTTAPLTGGGDLTADRTLGISAASGSAAGSMSSADFTKLSGIASGATANVVDNDTTLAADSTTAVPSQHAVKTYVATAITGTLKFKGSTDCSANPNYPAASKGDVYVVSVAGKIGGASGASVAVGDEYFATADNAGGTQAVVGASWDTLIHAVGAGGGLAAVNNLSDVASKVASKDTISFKGADIASATTTDLSTATGDYINVTGTTTITGLGTCAAGVERTVTFTGILTLTYNATSLILPGAANITTAAGDTAVFRSLGSGNWKCVDYARASGSALVSSATFATQAEARAGSVSTKSIAPDVLWTMQQAVSQTDGATITWDLSAGVNAKVTIAGNRTLAVTNPKEGATYSLSVGQDGTGSRTMTWPSSFDWGTTGAPTLTTTANKRDRVTFICTDASTPKFDAFLSGKGFS